MKHKKYGYSLLEFALVLPVFLSLLIGALDVNTLLQSYSALQDSTKTALRCLYPTDGKCVEARNSPSTPYYNYYVNQGNPTYTYEEVNYRGSARYFKLPILEFNNFRAKALKEVIFDVPTYTFEARKSSYKVEQDVNYFLKYSNAPLLQGSDPRNPDFVFLNATNTSYPEAPGHNSNSSSPRFQNNTDSETFTLSSSQNQTTWTSVGWFKLHPPSIPDTRPCYSNALESPNNSSPNFQQSCGGIRNATPIVLHIKGNALGTNIQACGKAVLKLTRPNGEVIDLGGQSFEGPISQANFYPRGVPWSHVPENLQNHAEFTLYQNSLSDLEYNKKYFVEFRLVRNNQSSPICKNGEITWGYSGLDAYVPRIREETASTPCSNGALLSQSLNTFQCLNTPYPPQALFVNNNSPRFLQPHQVVTSESHLESQVYSEAHARQRLNEHLNRPLNDPLLDYSFSQVAQTQATYTQSCPNLRQSGDGLPNYGVAESANASGVITTSQSAQNFCSPELQGELLTYNVTPQNLRWSETNELPLASTPIRWTKQTCNTEPPSKTNFPAELPLFAKLSWSGPFPTNTYEPHYTGPETWGNPESDPRDPLVIKSQNQNYACTHIQVEEIAYNDSLPNLQIPERSLFRGIHPNQESCNWKDLLRNDAVTNLNMPSQAFFLPAQISVNNRQVLDPPPSSCTQYQISFGQATSRTKIEGGPFLPGVLPEQCSLPGTSCSAELAHIEGAETGYMGPTYNTANAQAVFWNELNTFLPWAKLNCEDSECATVNFQSDSDTHLIQAQANIKVPLRLLFNHSVTLSYQEKERWEGAHLF